MTLFINILSALVLACLIGVMLYVTKALRARKAGDEKETKGNLRTASFFVVGYLCLNLLRLLLEGKLL